MKVLVLNGSPKAKSDTMVFTSAFLKGLNCQNEHEIKIVNLIEKKIRACTGCFECFKSGKGTCVIDDDQNKLLGEYAESQIVIWSFPLYAFGMPGHLKTFLDRTVPLISMKMVETEKGCRHVRCSGVCSRHNVVICGCGFPEYEHNFMPAASAEGFELQEFNGNLCASGAAHEHRSCKTCSCSQGRSFCPGRN